MIGLAEELIAQGRRAQCEAIAPNVKPCHAAQLLRIAPYGFRLTALNRLPVNILV